MTTYPRALLIRPAITGSMLIFIGVSFLVLMRQTVLSGESQRVARGHSAQRGLRAKQIFLPNQIT